MEGQRIGQNKSDRDCLKQHTNWVQMFTPQFITVLRQGYSFKNFKNDVLAGLTVAIIAIPLSIAIAIASGASPIQGLYTSIWGGFIVSLLGGSRFQIGGPAGAFIVVVATTIAEHGMDGLFLAMLMSGLFLALMGYLQLGNYIKYIPYPVTIGFTAGIGVIIFFSQLINILGLELPSVEPGPFLAKMVAIWGSLYSFNIKSFALWIITIIVIIILKKWRPQMPAMLIAIILTSLIAFWAALDVTTIGSRFGSMPSHLSAPTMPIFSMSKIIEVLPAAVIFALLGAIESLLSAVVADGMSGSNHRSNCELVGQGFANVVAAFFQGICVTGTIARTATNIRAGAHGPMAGVLHAIFILLFILFATPLLFYIPLSVLAAVLSIVSWNMIELRAIKNLLITSKGEAFVLFITFLLTILWGLAEAIIIGFAIACIFFIKRVSCLTKLEVNLSFLGEERGEGHSVCHSSTHDNLLKHEVVLCNVTGIVFFGSATNLGAVFDLISDRYKAIIYDFTEVSFIDASGVHIIKSLVQKSINKQVKIIICGASAGLCKEMRDNNICPPLIDFYSDAKSAVAAIIKNKKYL